MSDETTAWESDGGAVGVPSEPIVDQVPEPAVVAEVPPAAPGELFEVVGDRAVYGVEPGTVGPIVLTSDQRFALIAGGHIKPAATASETN